MRGEALQQLTALLERFDLRSSLTNQQIDAGRTPLREWVQEESERLSAVVPDLPPFVLNEQYRKHYRDMTVEEFRGVVESARQLAQLAKREQQQYMAVRNMDFAQERAAVMDRMREAHPAAFDASGDPVASGPDFVPSLSKAVSDLGDKFAGEFLGAETILNILEGGKFGQVAQSLFGRLSERSDWKAKRLGAIYNELKPLFKQWKPLERRQYGRKGYFVPEIGKSLTRENMLVTALLYGSKEGRERLRNYGWGDAQVQAIVSRLDERDWKLADAIWRLSDEQLWPELRALNDRTRGKSPPKVEALPYQTKFGEARGGYFRLKYDTELDERAHRLDEGAAVKELLGGGMGMSAKTNQGSSTQRLDNVTMRPRLDLGVFAESVNETVHDLAYREAVADTIRLLNDKGIQTAIKTMAGTPAYRALVQRVREVAAPPRNPSGFIEKGLSVARRNTIVTLMSGVKTALQNFTGLLPAMTRVDAGSLLREVGRFFSPAMLERYQFAMQHSDYMKQRFHSFDRDLQDSIGKLTVNGRILPDTAVMLGLMGIVDRAVSVPIWNAAFKDGMAQHGNDVAQAVQYADHIVRQTQGSGRDVDLPAIMSGHGGYGQLKRVFTMFYSYFNSQLQQLVRSGAIARQEAQTDPAMAVARFTRNFILLVVLPAVLTELLTGDGGDGEDEDQKAKRYARAVAMYGAGMFPLVRDLSSYAWATFDPDAHNYGYKITPLQSWGEGLVRGAEAAGNIAAGDGSDRDVKNLIMGAGYATGIPGKLISDTVRGANAFVSGEAGPEAVLFGPPRK